MLLNHYFTKVSVDAGDFHARGCTQGAWRTVAKLICGTSSSPEGAPVNSPGRKPGVGRHAPMSPEGAAPGAGDIMGCDGPSGLVFDRTLNPALTRGATHCRRFAPHLVPPINRWTASHARGYSLPPLGAHTRCRASFATETTPGVFADSALMPWARVFYDWVQPAFFDRVS